MPVELSKLKIQIVPSRLPELLTLIPQVGDVHVSEPGQEGSGLPARGRATIREEVLETLNKELKEIEDNLDYVFHFFSLTDVPPFFREKVVFQDKDLVHMIDQLDAVTNEFHHKIESLKGRVIELDQEINRLNLELFALKILQKHGFRAGLADNYKYFQRWLCTTFSENVPKLRALLDEAGIPSYFYSEAVVPGRDVVLILAPKHRAEAVEKYLKIHNCEAVEVPQRHVNREGVDLESCEREILEVNEQYANVRNELSEYRKRKLREFVAAKEVLANLKKLLSIERHCKINPKGLAILETWVPDEELERVQSALVEFFGDDVKLEVRKHKTIPEERGHGKEEREAAADGEELEEEVVPTLPKHRFSSPFITLVKLYGVPNYREVDPTPLVAVFFPILFGLMFGDVGHGIVLVLVGLLGALKYRKTPEKSDTTNFAKIIAYCGLGAILGGFLYGEWFGNPLVIGGEEFRLFVDPMESSEALIAVLKLCIILGVVHLNTGWLMQAVNYFRLKRRYLALTDSFTKIAILSAGTYLIFTYGFNMDSWLSGTFPPITLVVIPALGFIVFKPLGKVLKVPYLTGESYGQLVGEGGLEAFELFLGILSNVASYSRVFALLMAHVGLMSVVEVAASFVTVRTILDAILVQTTLTLGNALVIVLETMMAMIQDLRLHFYEFFSKFYTGNGVLFSALKLEEKYSKIVFTGEYE
ncbi:MAG: V-type ATP synthase subunit I [Promethearchaeota archaeon]